MSRLLRKCFKVLADMVMWFVSLALLICLVRMPLGFTDGKLRWGCLGGFVAGAVVFWRWRLIPLYVFGHELTHWAVAMLFLRKTSNIRLRMYSGSVNVDRPNIWITLAPYFVPFYMLVLLGVYGIVLFFRPSLPQEVEMLVVICIGATYAYHLVLTYVAISNGQQDLRVNGVMFSLSLIVLCNLFFLYLGLMLATRQLNAGGRMLGQQVWYQMQLVWQLCAGLLHSAKA